MPGDRYDARTCVNLKWPSRRTTLDQISRDELNVIMGSVEFDFGRPSRLSQFSDAELCEIYAEGLPRV